MPDDVPALAALHAESWRSAYRGMMPDAYLDGPILDERMRFWLARMNGPATDRRLVLEAVGPDGIDGFVCVVLDARDLHTPGIGGPGLQPGTTAGNSPKAWRCGGIRRPGL